MNLATEILTEPERIKISEEEATIDKISQSLYFVDKKKKIDLLIQLLNNKELKSVLVFSRTKHGANKIVKILVSFKIMAVAIHGNKSQGARQEALFQFKAKKIRVLVATDIAARGIDIDELTHVINFDLPDVPETYIHRMGRTGRAGLGGVAISFCSEEETKLLQDIQRHIKMQIPVVKDPLYSVVFKPSSDQPKIQNSLTSTKPTTNKSHNSITKKKTSPYYAKPKKFSKYDTRNQNKKSSK
jgi:ATP-dependent RNA helicase RhlE